MSLMSLKPLAESSASLHPSFRPRTRARVLALATLLSLLSCAASMSPLTILAQSAFGTVQGVITDQSGAVIGGARISLRSEASLTKRETTSENEGNFVINDLRFGTYTLVVEKEGFLPAKQTIAVDSAAGQSLNLTLTPAPVNESVTVRDTDGAIETTFRLPATLRETPRSLTLISSERIREQNFRQVPDALAYVPNMTVNSYRTGGYHFYSRGYRMAPDDTRVDGFAGINVGGGFGAALFGVEQVVLLRGPAGLLYGSAGSPGGFINLITKKPQELRSTRIDLRTGGYAGNGVRLGERFSGGADVDSTGALLNNERVLYRTLFSIENMNYFTNDVLDRNRYANGSLTFKLDKEGRYTITPLVQYTRFNRPAGGGIVVSPSTSLTTNDNVSSPINERDISRPDVNLSAGGRVDETLMTGFDVRAVVTDRLRVGGTYRYIDFEYFINQFTPQVSTSAQINQLRTQNTVSRLQSKSDNTQRNHSYDINATYELRSAGWWRNMTQIGVYNRRLSTRTTTPAGTVPGAGSPINIYTGAFATPLVDSHPALVRGNPNETSYLNGYVQNRTSLDNNRWIVTLGLGYGRNTVNNVTRRGAFIPNAALAFNASSRLLLYASYAESFNPNDASLQDISGRINPFEPTIGKNYETGAKFDLWNRRLSSTVSFFHNEISNALVQSGPNDFNPNGLRYYVEAGTRRGRGVELTTDYQALASWRISGAASYLDAIYTGEAPASALSTAAIPGSRAEKSPRWSFNLWNRYDRSEGRLKGFGAGLGLIWQDERLGSNGARTRSAPDPLILPAFTRVDAALFYRLNKNIDFSLNFENLFDELIFVNASVGSSIEIAAPRNVSFRIGYRF